MEDNLCGRVRRLLTAPHSFAEIRVNSWTFEINREVEKVTRSFAALAERAAFIHANSCNSMIV
jgi:hypothetical protein